VENGDDRNPHRDRVVLLGGLSGRDRNVRRFFLSFHGRDTSDSDINLSCDQRQIYAFDASIRGMAQSEPEQILTITDKAARKAQEIKDEKDLQGYGVRIYVQQGGCSGYSYGMQFDDDVGDDDIVVKDKGVEFIVDEHSAEYLEGSEVDYVESLQSTGFDITNPNAESTCGCGESFKV
jgi:iron-sulfur cluster assembly accessory protein